jgi:hypothetical protein
MAGLLCSSIARFILLELKCLLESHILAQMHVRAHCFCVYSWLKFLWLLNCLILYFIKGLECEVGLLACDLECVRMCF